MTIPRLLAFLCGIAALPFVLIAFGGADFQMQVHETGVQNPDTLTRDLVASAAAVVLMLLALAFYRWHERIVRHNQEYGRGFSRRFSR